MTAAQVPDMKRLAASMRRVKASSEPLVGALADVGATARRMVVPLHRAVSGPERELAARAASVYFLTVQTMGSECFQPVVFHDALNALRCPRPRPPANAAPERLRHPSHASARAVAVG